jgi:NAD(P)H dehydrogenase (quinone)
MSSNDKPRILVVGATGNTGTAVTRQLLEKDYPVTAFVRRLDHRSEALSDAGASIFVGDLVEPDDLRQAMRGVQRAYFLAPWTPSQLHGAMNFAVAAEDAQLEVVVALTQWLAHPNHPSIATRQSYLTDRIFNGMAKVDTVTINTGWLADNYMEVLGTVAQLGIFPFRLGEGKTAPVSNEDVARVAVGALVDPAPHIGKFYRPTGPELLDPHQLAVVYAKILGRPVKYQELSEKMFLKALKSMGMAPYLVANLRHYIEDYRRGSFEEGAPNDVVLEVGGSEPEDFETITRRYVAANPMSRPSVANKLRAIAEFMKILLTPAPDLSAYDKALNLPVLRAAQFSVDNQSWRETHAVPAAFGTTSAFNEGHIRVPLQNSNDLVLRERIGSVPGKEGREVQDSTISSIASTA